MKNKSNIDFDLLGFLDDNISIFGVEINSVKVISSIKNWMPKENEYFVCAIANRSIRKKIIDDLTIKKAKFINLIDPSSIISKFATIGIGNIIYPNTIISSNVIVGNHVIINMNTGANNANIAAATDSYFYSHRQPPREFIQYGE
jgi:bifunctional N-acetylglucosamine-1-phosphate-uridyltransferase/glucosamine-1-phosphate-acetyltransferase GlmU-like protein